MVKINKQKIRNCNTVNCNIINEKNKCNNQLNISNGLNCCIFDYQNKTCDKIDHNIDKLNSIYKKSEELYVYGISDLKYFMIDNRIKLYLIGEYHYKIKDDVLEKSNVINITDLLLSNFNYYKDKKEHINVLLEVENTDLNSDTYALNSYLIDFRILFANYFVDSKYSKNKKFDLTIYPIDIRYLVTLNYNTFYINNLMLFQSGGVITDISIDAYLEIYKRMVKPHINELNKIDDIIQKEEYIKNLAIKSLEQYKNILKENHKFYGFINKITKRYSYFINSFMIKKFISMYNGLFLNKKSNIYIYDNTNENPLDIEIKNVIINNQHNIITFFSIYFISFMDFYTLRKIFTTYDLKNQNKNYICYQGVFHNKLIIEFLYYYRLENKFAQIKTYKDYNNFNFHQSNNDLLPNNYINITSLPLHLFDINDSDLMNVEILDFVNMLKNNKNFSSISINSYPTVDCNNIKTKNNCYSHKYKKILNLCSFKNKSCNNININPYSLYHHLKYLQFITNLNSITFYNSNNFNLQILDINKKYDINNALTLESFNVIDVSTYIIGLFFLQQKFPRNIQYPFKIIMDKQLLQYDPYLSLFNMMYGDVDDNNSNDYIHIYDNNKTIIECNNLIYGCKNKKSSDSVDCSFQILYCLKKIIPESVPLKDFIKDFYNTYNTESFNYIFEIIWETYAISANLFELLDKKFGTYQDSLTKIQLENLIKIMNFLSIFNLICHFNNFNLILLLDSFQIHCINIILKTCGLQFSYNKIKDYDKEYIYINTNEILRCFN